MSYILGNYYHKKDSSDSNVFMTLVKKGAAGRRPRKFDSGVNSFEEGIDFQDEIVYLTTENNELLNNGFQKGVNYYFHGQIKRMSTTQDFNIKLETVDEEGKVQFIKNIQIISSTKKAGEEDWVDVEFIFTPVADFDILVFELKRTTTDFSSPRFAQIIYQELSIINNILPTIITNYNSEPLIKIGVNGPIGTMMCINGEQIHIGKTNIYEVRNGTIDINAFSVVCPAKEKTENALLNLMNNLSARGVNITETDSQCLFGTEKERTINEFSLDYIYEREDN